MASVVGTMSYFKRALDDVKYDWYQTDTHVVIEILDKFISNVEVGYRSNRVELNFDSNNDTHLEKIFNMSHSIDASNCHHKIFPSKVQIKLKKTDSGRWTQLLSEQAPSNKTIGRNWDELVAKMEEDGATDSDNGALNSLFQKIYSQGSDEVKKAMNKSFAESGGTVLSTNWDSVKKDNVQMKPPDGLEWRSWDAK